MDSYLIKHSAGPRFFFTCIVCFFVFFFQSCGRKSDTGPEQAEREAVVMRDEVLRSLNTSKVTEQLHASGAPFDSRLLHDVNRAKYIKRDNKAAAALNFGVYMSDLSYLMAFNKRDEAGLYFEACYQISDYLGMKKQFGQALQFGFNEIISGDERLEKSFDHLFKEADNTVTEEEFKKYHAASLTGYYIEELYRLSSFVQSYVPADSTDHIFISGVRTLVDQNDELNNLASYFDHIKMKPEGISAYQDLLELQKKYLALDREKLLSETDPSTLLKNEEL
ncbi:MAG TPA: hypothetical protein VF141_20360, partial [Chryseolinea sp.]